MQSLTPNTQRKSGARRARQNKTPRSDAIILRGRQRISVATADGAGGVNLTYQVTPQYLGDRVMTVATLFSRYRIRSLVFELRSKMPTNTYGTYVHGVDDDADSNESSPPTPPAPTEQAILDFRTSAERHAYMDSNLRWRPLDASKWYYTNLLGLPTDRFTSPCVYQLFSSDNFGLGEIQVFDLDIHYQIEFAGSREPSYIAVSMPLPPTPSGQVLQPTLVRTNPSPRK